VILVFASGITGGMKIAKESSLSEASTFIS